MLPDGQVMSERASAHMQVCMLCSSTLLVWQRGLLVEVAISERSTVYVSGMQTTTAVADLVVCAANKVLQRCHV